MSCNLESSLCSFFRLASFIYQYAFKVLSTSFCGLIAYIIFLLNDIRRTTVCLAIHLLPPFLNVSSQFGVTMYKATNTLTCKFLYRHKVFHQFGKYLRAWLLNYTVRLCLALDSVAGLSSRLTVSFCMHSRVSSDWELLLLCILVSNSLLPFFFFFC